MVGFHIELGQAAREFRWPEHLYDEDRVPIARCVAVEDCDVPKRYWRRGVIPITADISLFLILNPGYININFGDNIGFFLI